MLNARVIHRLALSGMLVVLLVLLSALPPLGASPGPADRSGEPQIIQTWLGWTNLGKPAGVTSVRWPVVGQNQDGRLEVFAGNSATSDSDRVVYHIWQTVSGWSSWDRLGGTASGLTAPSIVQNYDGRLEVFAQSYWLGVGGAHPGDHYEAAHIYQTAANGPWGSWSDLSQPSNGSLVELYEPYAGRHQDGRLIFFARGNDGDFWSRSQAGAGVDTWSAWTSLGKPSGVDLSPVLSVGQQQDGSLDIFTYGSNNQVYHNWQTAPNGGWNGWISFNKPPGVDLYEPAAGRNQDGRVEFFTCGSDGQLWHKWQTTPNNGWAWSASWGTLGKPPGVDLDPPVVGQYGSGAMNVLARGSDSQIWSVSQTAPSNGWGTWQSLGKPLGVNLTEQIAVGRFWTGFLALFAVGDDGALWMNQEGYEVVLCYDLVVNVSPGGGGSVDLDPAPNCTPGTAYTAGTPVKLTAVANGGYGFDAWTGDVSGNLNPVTITMDGTKNVTANFRGAEGKAGYYLPFVVK